MMKVNHLDAKAPRNFSSLNDIEKHFSQAPQKLVEYIATAMKTNHTILGGHLDQFAKLVEVPLKLKGEQVLLSRTSWVSPEKFDDIWEMLALGKKKFYC